MYRLNFLYGISKSYCRIDINLRNVSKLIEQTGVIDYAISRIFRNCTGRSKYQLRITIIIVISEQSITLVLSA